MTEPRYYPGSRRPIVDDATAAASSLRVLQSAGREYRIGDKTVRLYGIGDLAEALNRRPVTIRKWEKEGVIPSPTFNKPGTGGDPRGRRRLYSQAQIEGLVSIAADERILADTKKSVSRTQFKARAWALFKELTGK